MKEETSPIIDEIIEREWRMFSAVQSLDGQTACQRQPDTFDLQRRSQYLTWPAVLLCSYRDDLRAASDEGRNLMTEKYARMMEHTDPDAFAAIEERLPPLEDGVAELADGAADLIVSWEADARARHPFIVERGRDLSDDAASRQGTSFETYLRAELRTYSPRTLRLYARHLQGLADQGINGSELIYEQLVRLYGYESLDEASAAMSAR